jgi:hypothetical protein
MGGVAVAVGEGPAGFLHENLQCGEVVRGDSHGIDGQVHGPFCHETVLPKITEASGPARFGLDLDQR